MAPREPRRTCPTCERPVAVMRVTERMRPHDNREGRQRAGSWAVIDLYGGTS